MNKGPQNDAEEISLTHNQHNQGPLHQGELTWVHYKLQELVTCTFSLLKLLLFITSNIDLGLSRPSGWQPLETNRK